MRALTRGLIVALVIGVALSSVPATALATTGDSDAAAVGNVDVTIEDERVHVTDVEVSGDGLPSVEIDERTYTIDSASLSVDGVTVGVGDRTYEIGDVEIEVENVGVTLEDVAINPDG